MSSNMPKKPVKVHVEFPHLSAPNNGYDENGLWNGMTPDQVRVWLQEFDYECMLHDLEPPSSAVN